jgi:hypothetical protein
MHIRCGQCRALTQVQIHASSATPVTVACSGCSRRYRLSVNRPGATTDQERYRRAKTYAETNQIDLASAYSVLEGIMSLEEARAAKGGLPAPAAATPAPATPPRPSPTSPAQRPASAPTVKAAGTPAREAALAAPEERLFAPPKRPRLSEAEASFDPGFATAVRDGNLTVQQAMERGDRRTLALRLSQRHRLPMPLAEMVADNRITVRQALAQKAVNEAKEPPRPQTSVSHGVWNFMVLSIGALILGALGVHVYQTWGEFLAQRGAAALAPRMASAAARPAPAAPQDASVPLPPPPLTVPKTDTTGQLVEVSGPDPRSVLIVFCSTGRQAGLRQPVEISPGIPPSAAQRLGIFRSIDQPGAPTRAIRIRKDPRTGRWIAGDGRTPIATEEPPAPAPGTQTVPVSLGSLAPSADPQGA